MSHKMPLSKAHFFKLHLPLPRGCLEKLVRKRLILHSLLPWPIIIPLLSIYWPQILTSLILAFLARGLLATAQTILSRRRLAKVVRMLNERADKSDVFYSANGFVGRATSVSLSPDQTLVVSLFRLDYSKDRPLLTASSRYQGQPESSNVKTMISRRGTINFPQVIIAGGSRLALLQEGSEYHFLVCQHHHAWMLLDRLHKYRDQIENDISAIDAKSAKYLYQAHIPDAGQKIDQAKQERVNQLSQVESASVNIGKIIESLTIRIESIEDFGGLLLGGDGLLDQFHIGSSRQGESMDLALIQQDCEEISLILESYERLLSGS